MKHIKREQFIWEFQNKELIPSCYKNVRINNLNYNNENALGNTKKVVYVSLVPTYANCTLVNEDQYHLKKIKHEGKDGAGILIDDNYTVDSYLKKITRPKLQSNLRRAKARLEESFNISYKVYYGSISHEACDFLLKELHGMLTTRFNQKNEENMFLKEWKQQTNNFFNLINAKKASLFVIYNDDKPINISLNTHVKNNIFIAKANGFDTDYTKFSLGHIDIYFLLDWCLKNNYHFLDLGFGILDYKKKWCNLFYDFEYHLYTKKGSIVAKSIALMEEIKIKLKNSLKSFKPATQKTDHYNQNTRLNKPQKFCENNTIDMEYLKYVDIKNNEYKHIRQPIYNYLYHSKLHVDTIKTYKVTNQKNTYIIKNEENIVKIKVDNYES